MGYFGGVKGLGGGERVVLLVQLRVLPAMKGTITLLPNLYSSGTVHGCFSKVRVVVLRGKS